MEGSHSGYNPEIVYIEKGYKIPWLTQQVNQDTDCNPTLSNDPETAQRACS